MTGLLPMFTGNGLTTRSNMALLDRLFDDFGRGLAEERTPWTPALDVTEREADFVITTEVPGLAKEDIDIVLTQGLLTIKGEKACETTKEEDTVHISERRYGAFTRSLRLPDTIDTAGVTATTKDGVLTITIPKAEEEKPRKIQVQG